MLVARQALFFVVAVGVGRSYAAVLNVRQSTSAYPLCATSCVSKRPAGDPCSDDPLQFMIDCILEQCSSLEDILQADSAAVANCTGIAVPTATSDPQLSSIFQSSTPSSTSGSGSSNDLPWTIPIIPTNTPAASNNGLDIGAIVGGVVGGILGLAIIIAVVVVVLKKRNNQNQNRNMMMEVPAVVVMEESPMLLEREREMERERGRAEEREKEMERERRTKERSWSEVEEGNGAGSALPPPPAYED